MYRVSDTFPLEKAVIEMGRFIQCALYFLNCLPANIEDGVLCDATMDASRKFYYEYGPFEFEIASEAGIW